MPDHGKGFKHYKTVGALKGTCRSLQDDAECLLQVTADYHRHFPDFSSVDNQDHKSAQCDWDHKRHISQFKVE